MTLGALPLAEIVLGSPDWLRPVGIALAIAVLLSAWGYLRVPGGVGVRLAGFALKTLGLAALAALLLEPLWTHSRPRSGQNLVALVADNSQSLGIGDGGSSRGEQLGTVLSDEKAPWLVRLAADFAVRRYQFDGRLENVGNFAGLNFQGRRSALGASLASLAERFKNQPLAAVVLFTDGLATDRAGKLDWPPGLPPVYPVVLGTDDVALDARIERVAVSQSEFEDAPVTVRVDASATGMDGAPLVARLFDEAGKVVSEQSQPAEADGASQTYRFQFRPEKPGLSFYSAEIASRESSTALPGAAQAEATMANNRRLVAVDRGQGPYRVLYVGGRPNWEYKFLNRAVLADKQLQLISLLRIARREPKFEWRSRSGESSNPLYRGFDGKAPEEAERYDQPVLVRLNTSDEAELRDGFPKTPEDLFAYHAIVLDDVEAEFFSAEQLNLLEQFVSRRGGGLLMLGGVDSLAEGNYGRTPVAGVLPVYLDRRRDFRQTGDVRLQMARDGWLQDWVRLRGTEEEERRRLDEMPGFQVMNALGNLKPGAVPLANLVDAEGGVWPGLATQRFGDGRSAVLALGDAWRWAMRSESAEPDLEKFWRQTMRWLVTDTPNRVSLHIEPTGDVGGPVRLVVHARDKRFQPLDQASVKLSVRTPDGSTVELEAEADDEDLGAYSTQFVPRADGAYRVSAKVSDGEGAMVGECQTGWAAEPAAEEFRSLRPDRRLLEDLAQQTGGEVIELNDLDSMVRKLSSRPAPINETVLTPLWHRPTVFLFAMACLIGEWGLRRRRGLP
jgi:uncharacterized membrane protein